MAFCVNCGGAVSEDWQFCRECGQPPIESIDTRKKLESSPSNKAEDFENDDEFPVEASGQLPFLANTPMVMLVVAGILIAGILIVFSLVNSAGTRSGGEKAMVERALRESCYSLPSNLAISGPTTIQEFSSPPRKSIYFAKGGGQHMYWWVFDSSDEQISMTTAYAGNEIVAKSWGCPVDISTRN